MFIPFVYIGLQSENIGDTTIPLNHTLPIPKRLQNHARERRSPDPIILRFNPYPLFCLSLTCGDESEQS